jgi:hypothetical protein
MIKIITNYNNARTGPAPKKAHAHGQIYFEPRPNYAKARALYMAAHALAPGEGNAAHQLAILAGCVPFFAFLFFLRFPVCFLWMAF